MAELPAKITHASSAEVGRAFVEVAHADHALPMGVRLTAELLAVMLGQSALETGNWSAMYNFNFGNVKATDRWLAAGGDYTYYDITQPGADAPVTENFPEAIARTLLKSAKPRRDDPNKLDMEIRSVKNGLAYCLFWPNHAQARFRAFADLRAGAKAFLDKLTGKYGPALVPAQKGDVHGYIALLKKYGPYFTANEAAYEKLVADRYRHYLPLATQLLSTVAETKEPPMTTPSTNPFDGYMQYPDHGAFVSALEDLVVPADADYAILTTDGTAISKLAIQDRKSGGLGRPAHGQILGWCAEHGLRLASPDELEEMHKEALYIAYYAMPTTAMLHAAGIPATEDAINTYRNARMRSERWCRMEDDEVKRRLAAAGYTGAEMVVNECKYWTTPKKPGGLPQIVGLWNHPTGTDKTQPLSDFHGTDPQMTDYLTGFKVVKVVRRQPWLEGIGSPKLLSLAERCLAWTGYQFGLGVSELPGAQSNPAILAYSKECRRGGTLLGVDDGGVPLWQGGTRLSLSTDEEHWCAAAGSAGLLNSLLPAEVPPHGLRVSVAELAADATAAKTLRDLSWTPTPGSLALEGRLGQSPIAGGKGHVRRVVVVEADRYFGIGGNENNTWGAGWYPRTGQVRADGHQLVGWIEVS